MRQIGLASRSRVLRKGLDLVRSVRELPKVHDVPAIALSGYTSKAKMALAAGFNAYVSKPIGTRCCTRTYARGERQHKTGKENFK